MLAGTVGVKLQSLITFGLEGVPVDIECHLSNGLPGIVIVGFANKAVDEARERLRGAFSSSQLYLPRKRIVINLAPADLPKNSTGFDLAIAAAILQADGQLEQYLTDEQLVIGELGLDGSVRAVRGVIGLLLAAKKLGYNSFFIPAANLAQAALVPDITLFPLENLRQLYMHLNNQAIIKPMPTNQKSFATPVKQDYEANFSQVVGQPRAKRALEIAAAGSHNVLMSGPPGSGKSLLAKAFASVLPTMSLSEMLEVTHLHSLASKKYNHLVTDRPLRAPHHSASDMALIGGGAQPKPGEISLSHRGVLFLDELPEFKRSAIEALRQPLEDRVITVARAKDSFDFPAHFTLIATANPCPCGYYGVKGQPCHCLPYQILHYRSKLSGPIIDRIDLYVEVSRVQHRKLLNNKDEETSAQIAQRVLAARQRQAERFGSPDKTNDNMTNREIKSLARLSKTAQEFLNEAGERLQISARSYMRTIKLARTIADLEGSSAIQVTHMTEALQYRRREFNL